MNRQRTRSGIAGGIFLIGLGVLIMTGSWWPGIMFVIGLAVGADRAFHGKYAQALTAFAVCSAIGLLSAVDIPWNIFGPFILISLGVIVLVQGFMSKQN
jgi:putative Mn2+ efflux pump MntP